MGQREYAAPRLLLSTRSLDGVTHASRERLHEIQRRFREPESLAVTITKAVDAGAQGVLASPSPLLRAALAELSHVVPICAVLPTLHPHEYRMLEPGVEPLLARARRGAGPATSLRTAWLSFTRLSTFRHGDFATRVPVLLEAESARLPRRGIVGIVVAAPLTDGALAGGHRAFFERLPRFVHRRFGAAMGLETHNPGVLLRRLREWGARPDFVVGPANPPGLGMKPSREETLAEIARQEVPFVATELRAAGLVSLDEGVDHAIEHGARGLAPDLTEMDEVASELRHLCGLLTG